MRQPFTVAAPDGLFLEAAKIVTAAGYGSHDLICIELCVGYPIATHLIRKLQGEGILDLKPDEHARFELLKPVGFY